MKNLIKFLISLFVVYAMLTLFNSCRSENDETPTSHTPKNYTEITLEHIKAKESTMVSTEITASNSSGLVLKTDDVLVFKTSENRYGKLQIISIDPIDNYKLTIRIYLFANDGSNYLSTNSLEIHGTYLCDLDIIAEMSDEMPSVDFHWNRLTVSDTKLTPKNNAKFMKYPF